MSNKKVSPLNSIRRTVRKVRPEAFEHHWRDLYAIQIPTQHGTMTLGTGKTKRAAWEDACNHWAVKSRLT